MVEIKLDTSEVEKALETTILSHKQIMRKTLSAIGKKQAKAFNSAIASSVGTVSGELRKSYKYKVHVDDEVEKVTFFAKGNNQTKTIYPKLMALNYGATVKPLKKKVLHFQKGSNWFTTYGFNLPGKHFLEGAWEGYAGSGAYQTDVENMINKELQKYWG